MGRSRHSDKEKDKEKLNEPTLDPKYVLWILAAIKKVKGQKQRPSEDRISHVLETGYGLSKELISEQLELCVKHGKVLKVTFKGLSSYKNPQLVPQTMRGTIEKPVDFQSYTREALEKCGDDGSTMQSVEKYVQEQYGDVIGPRMDVHAHIKSVLKKGLSNGVLLKEGRNYRLASSVKIKKKANPSPVCGFCLGNAEKNKKGESEELISCSDCGNSGHPTCLKYSPELTARVRSEIWQCIECKTCSMCKEAGEADNLLFCDACDKGFHMECLDPPMTEMPNGSWVCFLCKTKTPGRKKKGHVETPIVTPPRRKIQPQSPEHSTAGLCPTPGCDSSGHITGRFATHRRSDRQTRQKLHVY